jgi:DNA topoisomerase-1
MKLVVVESPAKERTIAKFLGRDYIVKSSYGHVCDLPEDELGVDIENGFIPKYKVLSRARKILSVLKDIANRAEKVIMATDFDREGESISWHIAKLLGLDMEKVERITFHEITKEAIFNALKSPRKINFNLVHAQQARRILDRLVGYKLSPLLWEKIILPKRNVLSAGRVQSAALKLLVMRENEIENFTPQEYWTIHGDFYTIKENKEVKFTATLVTCEGKKINKLDISSKSAADSIISSLLQKSYKILEIKDEDKKKSPLPPFVTSTMQQEASRQLGFSSSKTMEIAQQLYEGVDIGTRERIGLITYHRTDSLHVAQAAQVSALKFISENYGKEYLPLKPRIYQTKIKNAQEAHEAIRPTVITYTPETIKNYLSQEQYKLYKLVWERFLASQMADAIFTEKKIIVSSEDATALFETSVLVLKFDGFLKVYPYVEKKVNKEEFMKLSLLSENEPVNVGSIYGKQHFTEPPPRYTEATLIKALESNGIGRPSTYATIISTLLSRKYCYLKNKCFVVTDLGKRVIEFLDKYFSNIIDIKFTSEMEEQLDQIARNNLNWQDMLKKFYDELSKSLSVAEGDKGLSANYTKEVADKKCPLCNAPMVVRSGPYGKFLSCSAFPKCKYKENYKDEKN